MPECIVSVHNMVENLIYPRLINPSKADLHPKNEHKCIGTVGAIALFLDILTLEILAYTITIS